MPFHSRLFHFFENFKNEKNWNFWLFSIFLIFFDFFLTRKKFFEKFCFEKVRYPQKLIVYRGHLFLEILIFEKTGFFWIRTISLFSGIFKKDQNWKNGLFWSILVSPDPETARKLLGRTSFFQLLKIFEKKWKKRFFRFFKKSPVFKKCKKNFQFWKNQFFFASSSEKSDFFWSVPKKVKKSFVPIN